MNAIAGVGERFGAEPVHADRIPHDRVAPGAVGKGDVASPRQSAGPDVEMKRSTVSTCVADPAALPPPEKPMSDPAMV